MNLKSITQYMNQENLFKVGLQAVAAASLATLLASNPLHAVIIRVADIALSLLLAARTKSESETSHVFTNNNALIKNTILVGLALTVLSPQTVGLAFLASNLASSLATRISLFQYSQPALVVK